MSYNFICELDDVRFKFVFFQLLLYITFQKGKTNNRL